MCLFLFQMFVANKTVLTFLFQLGVSKNTFERVFISFLRKETFSALMEWCSSVPYNPRYCVSCHQVVDIRILGVSSSSWLHSYSMSSCLVKLFIYLFIFLPHPFSRSKWALPSSTSLDTLKSLLFSLEDS